VGALTPVGLTAAASFSGRTVMLVTAAGLSTIVAYEQLKTRVRGRRVIPRRLRWRVAGRAWERSRVNRIASGPMLEVPPVR